MGGHILLKSETGQWPILDDDDGGGRDMMVLEIFKISRQEFDTVLVLKQELEFLC
jgi:hypothetical protein